MAIHVFECMYLVLLMRGKAAASHGHVGKDVSTNLSWEVPRSHHIQHPIQIRTSFKIK